jgi:hypothetical protein
VHEQPRYIASPAEPVYRGRGDVLRDLQLKEMVLGKDHPHTLMSINNLANSLDEQGEYAEAEAIRRLGVG